MEPKRRDVLHCPNCDSVNRPYLRFAIPNLVMTCAECGQTYDIVDLISIVEKGFGNG